MKKNITFIIIVCAISLMCYACRPQERIGKVEADDLVEITELNEINNITGFKAENNKFYFTGIEDKSFNFYFVDLKTKEITKEHSMIEEYDSFIPLRRGEALLVNPQGDLIYRKNQTDKEIDTQVSTDYGANLLVSPKLNKAIYTKGTEGDADLYLFTINEDRPILIKENISKEAFMTFSYTTVWSNTGEYFIFNNNEIYDSNGIMYDSIEAASIKWAPNDESIGFIRMPKELNNARIYSSHWQSYVGSEYAIYNLKQKKDNTVLAREGLVNVFEDISWSEDSLKTGLSIGEINRAADGALNSMKYNSIFIYDISDDSKKVIEDMAYNYKDFLFNNYIFGSNLGKRDIIEIIEIDGNENKKYKNPKILNSKDMFVAYLDNNAYILSDRELIRINKGNITQTNTLITFPWDVASIHVDVKGKQFVIMNKTNQIFILKT